MPNTIIIIALILCAVCVFLNIWSAERYRKRLEELEKANNEAARAVLDAMDELESARNTIREWQRSVHTHRARYTFSDHDLQRYGNDKQGMMKNAKQVIACALGRRILRDLGADEIIDNGALQGYSITIEVRKV